MRVLAHVINAIALPYAKKKKNLHVTAKSDFADRIRSSSLRGVAELKKRVETEKKKGSVSIVNEYRETLTSTKSKEAFVF